MGALVLDISMSLDGFVAGPDPTLDEPLGRGGDRLHEWVLGTRGVAGGARPGGRGADEGDSDVVDEHVARLGATIMGRRHVQRGRRPVGGRSQRRRLVGRGPAVPPPVFAHDGAPEAKGAARVHL